MLNVREILVLDLWTRVLDCTSVYYYHSCLFKRIELADFLLVPELGKSLVQESGSWARLGCGRASESCAHMPSGCRRVEKRRLQAPCLHSGGRMQLGIRPKASSRELPQPLPFTLVFKTANRSVFLYNFSATFAQLCVYKMQPQFLCGTAVFPRSISTSFQYLSRTESLQNLHHLYSLCLGLQFCFLFCDHIYFYFCLLVCSNCLECHKIIQSRSTSLFIWFTKLTANKITPKCF